MSAENPKDDSGATIDDPHHPSFPITRVKKIMKLDQDINKVNSEAAFLITCASEFFLQFLAEKSADVVIQKKKKTIKLEHLREAVKQHQPTSDFLLDCLPKDFEKVEVQPKDNKRRRFDNETGASGSKKIESFFNKCN